MAQKPPENAPPATPAVTAVIFTAGVEIQGYGTVSSVNPARMPGAKLSLSDSGVTVTTKVGVQTFVPLSMVKAVHLG